MKEISPKLANELLEKIEHLEIFCSRRAKIDSDDWLSASCMAFDIRQHLNWHINGYKNVDTGEGC